MVLDSATPRVLMVLGIIGTLLSHVRRYVGIPFFVCSLIKILLYISIIIPKYKCKYSRLHGGSGQKLTRFLHNLISFKLKFVNNVAS